MTQRKIFEICPLICHEQMGWPTASGSLSADANAGVGGVQDGDAVITSGIIYVLRFTTQSYIIKARGR